MSYLHISNLYAAQEILLFRECFALEKIHGTAAHISWSDNKIHYSSGGEKHERFVKLFNDAALHTGLAALGQEKVVIFGEAFGGKQQGQSWRYGKNLCFVAFEVKIGPFWLAVPQAEQIVRTLGLEFVYYTRISTDLTALDAERDAPSEQARRNGVEGDQPKEGIVLRPIIEVTKNNGDRIIAKHKRDEERETKTPRKVVDPAQLAVLTRANEIADEWVTPMRLDHVLSKFDEGIGIEQTGIVIRTMIEDIVRESTGEIVDSQEARRAIGKQTAIMFKTKLKSKLK